MDRYTSMMRLIYFMLIAMIGLTYCHASATLAEAARPGAATSAIEAISSFYTDSEVITKDFIPEARIRALPPDREAAIHDIRTMEWTEEPSERRSARLRAIVEGYMRGRISAIKKELGEKESFTSLLQRLNALKDSGLGRLDEALKAEIKEKKEIRPVPIIDKPPQETPAPDEAPGIWYR